MQGLGDNRRLILDRSTKLLHFPSSNTLVTIAFQYFSHQLKKKIALMELELCYLQVRSFLSQVRIIRISQQTSSLAYPTEPLRCPSVFEWLLKWNGLSISMKECFWWAIFLKLIFKTSSLLAVSPLLNYRQIFFL